MLRSSLRLIKVVRPSLTPRLSLAPQFARFKASTVIHGQDANIFRRLIRKMGFLDVSKSRLKGAGFLIYERCADGVDFISFIKAAEMPDTFFSWFLVTELHCWLIMTRAMAEGPEGRIVRNGITAALWQDVGTRIRKMEAPHAGQTLQDLSQQFRAAIIGYDEGLQSSDIVLAGALWRRLLQKKPNVKPETLEALVCYVRKQTASLDDQHRDSILYKPIIDWLPIMPCT